MTIQIWDETIPGGSSHAAPVVLEAGSLTAREIIRSRVQQEVWRYNQSLPETFQGLIQPEESEEILNGFRMKTKRPLDWEVQYRRACASFEKNGFLMVVDGCQVIELDEPLDLEVGSEVQFVKLVPLVGG
ncbi:MAG: hypothetical protein ABJF23_18270 [Bryobacteraceae bacterium]